MKEIVECVANISEGQNSLVIDKIAHAIESGTQTRLLHVDSGYDANRTVFTFIGDLKSMEESIHKMFQATLESVDMTLHQGKHPRLGAIDVCPFIPIQGISMDKLITWTNALAEKIANAFSIPIYLYEASSNNPERTKLESIRKGEYESLSSKMADPQWTPDYGPSIGWEKSGATILGARHFLLAYNINLKSKDVRIAKKIAAKIRGSGYRINGQKLPGLFPSVKAIGWYIEEFGFTQVSTNLTDYAQCSLHHVYSQCDKLARELGVELNGSELIGLIPKEPLILAGKYYTPFEKNEESLINSAVEFLGLSSIKSFEPEARIIELLL